MSFPAEPDKPAWTESLLKLCDQVARCLLAGKDFSGLHAMLLGRIPELLEVLGIRHQDQAPEMLRAFATTLALELWNVTPMPDNRFRPRRLPKPQRNDPCPCGSLRKFKQCCGAGPTPPDLGIDESLMLAAILDQLPQKALADLPLLDLHPEALALVAQRWLEDGDDKKAIKLLENLFVHLDQLDQRAELAADVLLGAYLDSNAPRKKQAFMERLKNAPDKLLRSTGWQRQATVFCDQGKLAQAWEAFREAQRLTPNEPALSHLEVLMLVTEGRQAEAKARAQFWSARLARDSRHDHSDLIAFINNLAAGRDETLLDSLPITQGPLGELARIVASWPAPACHYTFSQGELTPKKALRELEKDWREVIWEENDLESALSLLAEEALCPHSFTILNDLVNLCFQLPGGLPGSEQALARKLVARGESLRTMVLGKLKALDKELPWGFLDNRPMLRLVNEFIQAFASLRPQETLDLLRWCVTVANPNDNQGLREVLMHRLVGAGLAEEACQLAGRYSDDSLAGMIYGQILATHAAGRLDDAAALLGPAIEKRPKVWKMLLAANPKQPRSKNPGYITVGGDDEAWEYRENYLELWQQTGALAWGNSPGVKNIGKGKKKPTSGEEQGSLL